ncbi:MAG TPA: demethoxyubiquinone hydroxylase family protein, partial [Usitatibacter sp.]|nr:demethoxyubiquinone hydroxylase family protein [Usitatibacter sp.]
MTSLPFRRTTAIDALLGAADDALRTLSGSVSASRPTPATQHTVPESEDERRLSAGLMRVNHTGEVCAQA